MTPEEIKHLYETEPAASEQEARETEQEAMTDPEQARRFLQTMYVLSTEDPAFMDLLQSFLATMWSLKVKEWAMADDAYALTCAQQAIKIMELMKQGAPKKTPRGKPKTARSA